LDIEVGYLPGIPDRVVVNPEGSPVKRGHIGAEFALGSAEDRGPDKPLFGGKKGCLPVGFPGRTDAEYQGGVGKTTGHGISYHKIREKHEALVIPGRKFYSQ
jgi:hypothetical protein